MDFQALELTSGCLLSVLAVLTTIQQTVHLKSRWPYLTRCKFATANLCYSNRFEIYAYVVVLTKELKFKSVSRLKP